eukprot:4295237-Amphidinium_carterae.1
MGKLDRVTPDPTRRARLRPVRVCRQLSFALPGHLGCLLPPQSFNLGVANNAPGIRSRGLRILKPGFVIKEKCLQ